MEVKPGYKLTEAGVIPEDWEVHSIGQAMQLINGRAFKPEDWRLRGIPIIRIQNLNDANVSFNYYDSPIEAKHRVVAGDILFAWSGTTGTSFGARVWTGPISVLNQHIFKVIANERLLTQSYSFLILQKTQEEIEKQAHGFKASFVHVKKADLVKVLLPVPPLREQVAIATTLSDIDFFIQAQDKIIAKKRDIKKAAMQQLLTGKQRLPGFSGAWELKRLGDMGYTYGGLTGKTKADFGYGSARYIPFLNVISNVKIDDNNLTMVNVSSTETQNAVRKGDLFFNGSSETPEEVGLCSLLTKNLSNVYLNSFCFGFRSFEGIEFSGLYFAYFFRSQHGRELLYSLAQGATRYNLSKTALLRCNFKVPPIKEQETIATVLSDMDAEIVILEQKRDKTRAIKQGMMQELLTGRTRLV